MILFKKTVHLRRFPTIYYISNEKLLLLSRDGNEAEVEKLCFNHFKSVLKQKKGVTKDDISNFLGETSTKLKTLSNADKHFLRNVCQNSKQTNQLVLIE